MNNWQKIFTSEKLHQASLVRIVLEEKEYQPVLLNRKDSTYLFGNYEIYVSPEYVLPAIKIINDEIQFE